MQARINDGREEGAKRASVEGLRAENKSVVVWEDADYEAVIPRIRRERRSGCTNANFPIGLHRGAAQRDSQFR